MKKYLLILFALCSTTFINAQRSDNDLDRTFEYIIKKGRVPGFSVSLFTQDSIIYSKAFGYADVNTKKPYTKETTHIIASISKTIVATALMKAQELGYLKLDDPINKHLPYKVNNPYFPTKEITIRHLTKHASSLFYNVYMTDSLRELNHSGQYSDLGATLKSFLTPKGKLYKKENWMKHVPGIIGEYSNTGAALAAYIVEHSSGISFEQFTAKHIFYPIGMKNTKWFSGTPGTKMTKYYYGKTASTWPEATVLKDAIYPCGDLVSTAHDLSKFCQMVLNKGMVNSKRILTEQSIKEMLHFKKIKTIEKEKVTISVFWGKSKNELGIPRKLIGHNGGEDYVYTMMYFDPKKKIGYIMLVNTTMTDENRFKAMALIYQSLYRYGKYLKL